MNAVILPLNEFFYNHQKYDGLNPFAAIIHRHKWVKKFVDSRFGYKSFLFLVVYPLATSGFLFFLGPVYVYHYLLSGKKRAKLKTDKFFAAMDRWDNRLKSKNIYSTVNFFKEKKMKVIVYYSTDTIPVTKKKQNEFFRKIDSMKQNLEVFHVFPANSKNDVEDVIRKFNIDPDQSFFMSDGNIDLGGYSRLINHFDGSF